jgi:hypothetical protein
MEALKARVSTAQSPDASPAAAVEMKTVFEKRIQYVGTVNSEHQIGSANHYDIAKGNRLGHAVGCSDRQRLKSKVSAFQHLTAKVKES